MTAPPVYRPPVKQAAQRIAAPPINPASSALAQMRKAPPVYHPEQNKIAQPRFTSAVQGANKQKSPSLSPTASGRPVVQRMLGEWSSGGDDGSGQDAEMYLDQQRQEERRRNEERRRMEANQREVASYEYKYCGRTYEGRDAVIAKIINVAHNLPRADYGILLIDWVIADISAQSLPNLSVNDLVNTENDFKTAVLKSYARSTNHTNFNPDTQFGLTASHVDYK